MRAKPKFRERQALRQILKLEQAIANPTGLDAAIMQIFQSVLDLRHKWEQLEQTLALAKESLRWAAEELKKQERLHGPLWQEKLALARQRARGEPL